MTNETILSTDDIATGWRMHDGKGMPVHPLQRVDVMTKNGHRYTGSPAVEYATGWIDSRLPVAIVAYRVVESGSEPCVEYFDNSYFDVYGDNPNPETEYGLVVKNVGQMMTVDGKAIPPGENAVISSAAEKVRLMNWTTTGAEDVTHIVKFEPADETSCSPIVSITYGSWHRMTPQGMAELRAEMAEMLRNPNPAALIQRHEVESQTSVGTDKSPIPKTHAAEYWRDGVPTQSRRDDE